MTKPIDLIVANAMHEYVSKLLLARDLAKALGAKGTFFTDEATHDVMARSLLCNISHDAHIGKVYAALQAVGAPCSADDMREGVKAAAESGA